MYSIYDLMAFFALVLALVYWWRSREQHHFALRSARKYCRERGIQLLDETLVFKRFTLRKSTRGTTRLCRIYSFDFCPDGQDRRQGEIVIAGYSVMMVMLESGALEITEF